MDMSQIFGSEDNLNVNDRQDGNNEDSTTGSTTVILKGVH